MRKDKNDLITLDIKDIKTVDPEDMEEFVDLYIENVFLLAELNIVAGANNANKILKHYIKQFKGSK